MNQEHISKKTTIIICIICVLVITLSGALLLSLENKNNSVIMKSDMISGENDEVLITVNINTAPKEELMLLDNIGESKAEAIIEYRNSKPFSKPEDIMSVKGIGIKIYERIKNNISVE